MYIYDGQEKFEEHFKTIIRDKLAGLVDDAVIDHYKGLALLFLFSIDPEQGDLDAEKELVQQEFTKAQERNAKRAADGVEASSDSSQDEANTDDQAKQSSNPEESKDAKIAQKMSSDMKEFKMVKENMDDK